MNQRLHVLQLINSFSRGGAETLAWALATELAARGEFRSSVCAVGRGDHATETSVRRMLGNAGVETWSLVDGGSAHWLIRAARLRSMLSEKCVDIMQSSVTHPIELAACGSRASVVHVFHAAKVLGSRPIATGVAERVSARLAGALVAVSETGRLAATERLGLKWDRVRVIPNGVAIATLRGNATAGSRNRTRETLQLPLDAPLAVVVGRIDRNKGQDRAVEALARTEARRLHLAFAGSADRDPEFVAELREMIRLKGLARRCHFPGVVEDVGALLNASDLVIAPSRSEAFGLAVVEAMACAVPVVASDIPAHREISCGGRHALLFHDAAELASQMSLVVSGRRGCDIDEAARHVATSYDIGGVVERYVSLYESLRGPESRRVGGSR
ncbi:MAG: glycosyltransferase family 4 protein [Anaeromyxobacteraceae bacterium]